MANRYYDHAVNHCTNVAHHHYAHYHCSHSYLYHITANQHSIPHHNANRNSHRNTGAN